MLARWLVAVGFLSLGCCIVAGVHEDSSFDGFYHNEHAPEWGSIDSPFLRMGGGTLYADKTYQPLFAGRPNPRALSASLFSTPAFSPALRSLRNSTALMVFFGQQLFAELHDGLHQGCPVEYANIPVPTCDPQFDPHCTGKGQIPFTRSRFVSTTGQNPSIPRMQISEVSAWIDGGSIYGNGKTWADALRSKHRGKLKARDAAGRFPALNDKGLPFTNLPPPTDNVGPGLIRHPHTRSVKEFMATGNKGAFNNPAILMLQVLWFRNHNWHADRLWNLYGATDVDGFWTDERLFMEARKWNIAEYQSIAVNEWLPAFAGRGLAPYAGYQSTVNPGVADVFQAGAMRFGHSLVPSALLRRDAKCNWRTTSSLFGAEGKRALRTCNTFFRSNEILTNEAVSATDPADPAVFGHSVRDSIDEFVLGLTSQYGSREDLLFVDDLRNFVFGPLNFNRRDLASLNIQRGRDNGLPDYNTVRVAYGLPRVTSFAEITDDPAVQLKLSTHYGNRTDLIDLYVGGLAETSRETGNPGELFQRILIDQFSRTRNGDRFWYANRRNGLFEPSEILALDALKFSEIIRRNTNVPPSAAQGGVQDDVFRFRADLGDACPPPTDAELADSELDACTPLATHDYWTDASPAALPGTAMLFVSFFVLCVLALLLTVRYQRIHKKRMMDEIDRSFSKPTHEFDGTVEAPQSHFKMPVDFDPAAATSPMAGGGSIVTLSQPAPRVQRTAGTRADTNGSLDGAACASTPSVQRFKQKLALTGPSSASSFWPAPDPPSGVQPSPSLPFSVSGVSVSEVEPNVYGAVLYAPSMGTASVFAEIQERALSDKGKQPGGSAANASRSVNSSSSSSQVIHPGQSVGWLSIRSAFGDGESLYHVPLSFVHSVVIFGRRQRAHEQQYADGDVDAHAAPSVRSANHASSAAGPVFSPKSVAFSVSAMTRLTEELQFAAPRPANGMHNHGDADQAATPAPGHDGPPSLVSPHAADQSAVRSPAAGPGPSWVARSVATSPAPRMSMPNWSPDDVQSADDDPYEPMRNRSVLLRVPKRYDVWLVFPDLRSRASFVLELRSACARVGGRQLGTSNCLLVRQAVWSRAMLDLDTASVAKTTQVRAAELQRFFQQLISQSIHGLATTRNAANGSAPFQRQTAKAANEASSRPPASASHARQAVMQQSSEPKQTVESATVPVHSASSVEADANSASSAAPAAAGPVLTASAAQLSLQTALVSPAHGQSRLPPPGFGVTPASRSRNPSQRRPSDGQLSLAPLASAMQNLQVSLEQAESLLESEVTIEELAAAFELTTDHPFVRFLFATADRTRSGLVSFRGLEHVLLTLSKGPPSDKLRLLFDTYDTNGTGILEIEEITTLVRESMRVAEEYDTPDREARVEQDVAEAITSMYAKAGMAPGDSIDFDAFELMMSAPAAAAQQPQAEAQAAADAPAASSAASGAPVPADSSLSMMHRLLRRVKKPKSSHLSPRAGGKSGPPAPSSGLSPPHAGAAASAGSPAPDYSPDKARGHGSWASMSLHSPDAHLMGATPGAGAAAAASPARSRRLERLDSHVVLTKDKRLGVSSAPHLPLDAHEKRSLPMQFRTLINTYRAHIYLTALFYFVCFGIFAERYWRFAMMSEHLGIRRITGMSVPITRGCASVIAFCMGVLLLTVCKNLLSYLQSTRLARVIPFQSALSFHLLVAYTLLVFMMGHVVGHFFNWYQISTQPILDTPCWLPDVSYSSDFLPSFTFWIYGTPTNMTGVLLTLWMTFFFTVAAMRNYLYAFFMRIHRLFIVGYVLSVLHGFHQLFAYPIFWLFCIGPAIVLLLDRLWSFARVNAPLTVISAQVLPSKVLKLTITKPAHVSYFSGQYLRLASDFIARGEYHPFSVSSASHQPHLSVHVLAVGPFTSRLYQLYHPSMLQRRPGSLAAPAAGVHSTGPAPSSVAPSASSVASHSGAFMGDKVPAGFVARASDFYLPPLNVDGPYGGGHQGWSQYRTCVLIGAGIGITPFASILQDFMHQVQLERLKDKERERRHKKKESRRIMAERGANAQAPAADADAMASSTSPVLTKKISGSGQRVPVNSKHAGQTPMAAAATAAASSVAGGARRSRPPRMLYFIWIGRSHTGYEWLIDLIREAESLDKASGELLQGSLQVQMYITTPPAQFDLRTAMDVRTHRTRTNNAYAFERHFARTNGCSLFSGLRSSIGWGRPDFDHLFSLIAQRHQGEQIGLFTSGGPSVLAQVEHSCELVNSYRGAHFQHHAEQFQ